MGFINALSWWPQWVFLGLIPPAIIALYFLKLRREPLAVPSTYLWSRAIEDLHVNSLWQKLRQSLLLLLQLLVILGLIFALIRPGWQGTQLLEERYIFLIDTSASMAATDVEPTRLEAAKKQALDLVEQMQPNAVAMVITFSDSAKVEQPFTNNRRELRNRITAIEQTQRTSDLNEALRTASGLANPGQSSDPNDAQDVQVAAPQKATLLILSDGGINTVPDFRLGNLEPTYLKIGSDNPSNIAITSFATSRNIDKPGMLFIYAGLENSGTAEKEVSASLYLNNTLLDAVSAEVPGRDGSDTGRTGIEFPAIEELDEGLLRLEIETKDQLDVDNKAYAVIRYARKAKVLLLTPGNYNLQLALKTEEADKMCEVFISDPAHLQTQDYKDHSIDGTYDLIIYDQCAPEKMPQSNTLFIGRIPPGGEWAADPKQGPPFIVDIDQVHPLTQLVAMGNVRIVDCTPLKPPKGAAVLIDANVGGNSGVLYAVMAREGFEDAVLGFEIVGSTTDKVEVNTDWTRRRSFPVFVLNAVKYFGGVGAAGTGQSVQPGKPYTLRSATAVTELDIQTPEQQHFAVPREVQNTFVFTHTDDQGFYDVREGSGLKVTQQFAVNLFDSRESDLLPREKLEIGYEEVEATTDKQSTRIEMWRWMLVLALGVLLFEWYIYNKRVYL